MCGIYGLYPVDQNKAFLNKSTLSRMDTLLEHRGPDDSGSYYNQKIALGHRRLSIIDLTSLGRQPMLDDSENLCITFNGEIYNYIELRQELEGHGYKFKSRTDTEVILKAYALWGPDCVKKFNGMWAFALWDKSQQLLFCSRDRFGKKPFYYYWDGSLFVFASEAKAIVSILPKTRNVNWQRLYAFLTHGILQQGVETFFQDIKRLAPATNIFLSNGRLKFKTYWSYFSSEISNSYDFSDIVETFRELFIDAVRIRLRSDVPIGISLSGGLDSSSILAVVSHLNGNSLLRSFSAVFGDYIFDESQQVKLLSKHYKTHSYLVHPDRSDFTDTVQRITWHLDSPSLSPAIYSLWEVVRKAHGKVKVLLDGQGGDELLGGYIYNFRPYYLQAYLDNILSTRNFQALPDFLKKSLFILREGGKNQTLFFFKHYMPFTKRLYNVIHKIDSVLAKDFRNQYEREHPIAIQEEEKFCDPFNQKLYETHRHSVLPELLHLGDSISMAHSIETRLPFMDYRLVEFCFALPFHEKFDGLVSKCLLRDAMKNILLEEIRTRKTKIGFATPFSHWMRHGLYTQIRDFLLEKRRLELFNYGILEKALKKMKEDKQDRLSSYVWRWLTTEAWFRNFIDKE
jgi:asparagine synthase (glutamine-hydrolysing)